MNGLCMIIQAHIRNYKLKEKTLVDNKDDSKASKSEWELEIAGAEAALKRAAKRARERAWSAGVGVVYLKDGRIVVHPVEAYLLVK